MWLCLPWEQIGEWAPATPNFEEPEGLGGGSGGAWLCPSRLRVLQPHPRWVSLRIRSIHGPPSVLEFHGRALGIFVTSVGGVTDLLVSH